MAGGVQIALPQKQDVLVTSKSRAQFKIGFSRLKVWSAKFRVMDDSLFAGLTDFLGKLLMWLVPLRISFRVYFTVSVFVVQRARQR